MKTQFERFRGLKAAPHPKRFLLCMQGYSPFAAHDPTGPGCTTQHCQIYLGQQQDFCLIEVRAMVVAVQQHSAKCTAILTVCIVLHLPPPCAVTIHKTSTDQQWNRFQTVPAYQIKGQCAGNTPNTLILANRSRARKQCNIPIYQSKLISTYTYT